MIPLLAANCRRYSARWVPRCLQGAHRAQTGEYLALIAPEAWRFQSATGSYASY